MGAARATRAKAIIRTARLVLFIETLLNQVDDDAFLQRVLTDCLRYARRRYVLERRVFFSVTSLGTKKWEKA
jgi:hypothetical protein